METVVGRDHELRLLKKIEESGEAELVTVYGRRRVGKTYLIRNGFKDAPDFEFCGLHHASLSQHLESFALALGEKMEGVQLVAPSSWLQAFNMLINYLKPLVKKRRRIIFIDEFPWIHTPRSGFLPAFEHFWNTWASKEKNLVVVICGSAAAWMIKNVIRNRGGLHNRVTRRIRLLPFTLQETASFLKSRKVNLNRYQLIELYMALGGVPQYLHELEPGESPAQAIDRLCFQKDGLLYDEFRNLYHSLFDHAGKHMDVIRALAKKSMGLTRKQIIKVCELSSGGYTTGLLEELTESGFISLYVPFGSKIKDSIYKLTDEYSLFYLHFIENTRTRGAGSWLKMSDKPAWKIWSGYAYETICLKHVDKIKQVLGIADVYSEVSSWRHPGKKGDEGTQIDLLIDRSDSCINVCEIKFSNNRFKMTRPYADDLKRKLQIFKEKTQTRKTLFLTLITTFGVSNSDQYPGLLQKELTLDFLFQG